MTAPIDPAWTISRIAIQIAAAVLVTIFAVGVRRVGALLARALRVEERGGGLHVLLGLTAYVLLGTALGAVGWLHWPLLAGLALAPGGAAAVGALGGWARPLRRFVPRPPARGRVLLGVCVALVAVPFLIDAITPPTHYDLLANYLAVAKDDLLQGSISPLEHNVHSSQSLALHVLLAYLLSLAEMVRAGSFVFGSAMTVPAFGLMALVLIVRSLTALARRLVPDGTDHRPVALLASLLFLGFPQTQILASLHSCDLITTSMALLLVAELVGHERWNRRVGVALGLAAGLLVASKPQLAVVVALAGLVVLLRSRHFAPTASFFVGTLAVVGPLLIRNAIGYGNALFPYLTGGSPQDAAGRALLAENGFLGGAALVAFATNVVRIFTLQPETGISFAVLPLVLLPRPRRLEIILFAGVPLLALAALTGSTYHALRWAQPSVALLFLLVAANWMSLAGDGRWGKGVASAFAIAAFLVGLARAQAINPNLDVLRTDEATFITRRLPSYPVRARLVSRARRVLYIGELAGYFGAENGVIPSVFDDAYLARLFRADTVEEIAERLSAAGFSHVAVGHAYDGRLGRGVGWRWIEPGRAAVVVQFFASLRVVTVEPAITVYALSSSVP